MNENEKSFREWREWLLDWLKGPRSTRTARLLAKNLEMRAATEKLLADVELEARGFRKEKCEVCKEPFESTDRTRKVCNEHLGRPVPVRRIAACNFPGCETEFETFSRPGSPNRTRCNEHAGRKPR